MDRQNTRIIFHDFADINYSSYWLTGLIENQNRYNYQFSLSRKTPAGLLSYRSSKELKKNLFAISVFEARIDGDHFLFCIDAHDNATREFGFNLPLLETVRYYYKVNYNAAAIHADPVLRDYGQKILPAQPNFPVRVANPLRFLPRPLPNETMDWNLQKMRQRAKRVFNMRTLADLRAMRQTSKDIDVFFAVAYYHKQEHSGITEARREIVERLFDHPGINAVVGLVSYQPLPPELEHLHIDRFDEKTYLANIARGKTAIYVRGPHDCHSFKFGELLAMAKPIIGQPILNHSEEFYNYPCFEEQFAYETPQQIVERVAGLLKEPETLQRLAQTNARTFDEYMVPQVAMTHILQNIIPGSVPEPSSAVANVATQQVDASGKTANQAFPFLDETS